MLDTRGPITLEARPHPLRDDVFTCEVDYGLTLAELLPHAHDNTYAYIGGVLVERKYWHQVRPKPGAHVSVGVIAADGDGNKVLRTVLQIAVAVAAIYTGQVYLANSNLFTQAIATAAIQIAGNLAINALVPPQLPSTGLQANAQDTSFNRKLAITGTRNNANLYGPVPVVYGRHRIFPPWQAAPYTETLGENQYLRGLLNLGYGPMNVYDIRIGDTPIDEFEDVEYEINESPALFSGSVSEEGLALTWGNEDDVGLIQTRTTSIDADEISLDLMFPQGLYSIPDDGPNPGTTKRCDMVVRVEYSVAGSGVWANARDADGIQYSAAWIGAAPLVGEGNATDIYISGAARENRRAGLRWSVPRGQYDVRVTKISETFFGDAARANEMVWVALRTYTHETPIQNLPDCQFMAFRIRATDQLNGITDRINMEIARLVPVWDEATDTWSNQETSDPAWLYVDAACGVATRRPVDKDARFIKEDIKAWADDNAAKGRTFNAVIDAPTTTFELMRDIASVGRATFDMRAGKYTVVRDIEQAVPTQLFTPRNSWGFSGELNVTKIPHALRVWYTDPASGWQRREKLVYRDGFDDTNATRFEELDARGVTDQVQAWRMGRYYFKEMELRGETFRLNADVEHLAARRGDLVYVGNDVIQAGAAFGRVKSVVTAVNGDATSITLDEIVTMEAGKTYALRIRRVSDGTQVQQAITTEAGETDTLVPAAPVPDIGAGDLVAFGETANQVLALKLKDILPGPDLAAQLRLVPAAPEIHDVDTELPPPDDDALSIVIDPALIKCCPPVIADSGSGGDGTGARSNTPVMQPNSGGIKAPAIRLHIRHADLVPES